MEQTGSGKTHDPKISFLVKIKYEQAHIPSGCIGDEQNNRYGYILSYSIMMNSL
jgi:hypothetical protein